ncbi:MAG: cytochrome C [Planctomycetota bacterium]
MLDFLKNAINAASAPEWLISISTLLFAVMFFKLKWFARKETFAGLMALLTGFLVVSAMNESFREILLKPDNVPIILLVVFVSFFFWLSMRQAVENDQRIAEGRPVLEADNDPKMVYVWPHLVYTELICIILMTVGLIVWSIFVRAPLEEPANPTITPNPSKAPWYFLGLQEMLVYYDPWLAGVVFPTLIVVGLMAIPFIDKNPKGNGYYTFKERKLAITTFCFGFFILWVLLVVMGTFLRGPNWNFFGPYEHWTVHKVVPLVNVNLNEFFWTRWLGMKRPDNPLIRELPGFAVILVYFGALPPLMARMMRKLFQSLGFIRFNVFAMLFLWMAALPIKMVLRWVFNLKYIVAIPEYFFNI